MIKVIIVDDQTFVAKSLKRVLSNERGIEVVATAHDQAQAVECAEIYPHDVILMDIMLGAGSGLDAAREICGRVSTTKIVFMSAHVDPTYVAEVLAQKAGGYLSKSTLSLEEMVEGILEVYRGGRVFSREALLIAAVLLDDDERGSLGALPEDAAVLSAREREVFRLRAGGMTNADVAQELGVKVPTVRTTWAHALGKIGIRSEDCAGYVPVPR